MRVLGFGFRGFGFGFIGFRVEGPAFGVIRGSAVSVKPGHLKPKPTLNPEP